MLLSSKCGRMIRIESNKFSFTSHEGRSWFEYCVEEAQRLHNTPIQHSYPRAGISRDCPYYSLQQLQCCSQVLRMRSLTGRCSTEPVKLFLNLELGISKSGPYSSTLVVSKEIVSCYWPKLKHHTNYSCVWDHRWHREGNSNPSNLAHNVANR